jgi:SAM-dependent methyltransferase
MKYLKRKSKILDFGCGPGDMLAVLASLEYIVYGYDDLEDDWHNSQDNKQRILQFMEFAGINFSVADSANLPYEKEFFDLIMLNDVLEHLHDSPRELLNKLLEVCKPEGYLLITVPNAVNLRKRIDVLRGKTNLPSFESYYWYPGKWRGHVREYVKNDLDKLAEYLDLEVLELRGCDHMLRRIPRSTRGVYLLVTKYFDGLKDTLILVARKRKNWQPVREREITQTRNILNKYTSYNY